MSTRKNKKDAGLRSRRQFTKSIALLAAAPLAGSLQPAVAQEKADPPAPAQALTDVVRSRYGKHLTEEQLKAVQRGIERNLRNADTLRKTNLKNSDEPDFVFSADVL